MVKEEKTQSIIPDPLFFELWMTAEKTEDKNGYISQTLGHASKKLTRFVRENHIQTTSVADMLGKIYDLSHLDFCQIVQISGKRKSQIRDIFCIPIRTIEDWYTGKNRCPAHVRLMLLKHFFLLDLGTDICLESELNHQRPEMPDIVTTEEKLLTTSHLQANKETCKIPAFNTSRSDTEKEQYARTRKDLSEEKANNVNEMINKLISENSTLFKNN